MMMMTMTMVMTMMMAVMNVGDGDDGGGRWSNVLPRMAWKAQTMRWFGGCRRSQVEVETMKQREDLQQSGRRDL